MSLITGIGIISALGKNAPANLQALLDGNDGLSHPDILLTNHKHLFVGEVKVTNKALAAILGIELTGYSRTALLGIYALNEALQHAQLSPDELKNKRVAFINATTVGGMSEAENMYEQMASERADGDFIPYIDSLDCADCTQRIAAHFGLNGFMATVSTACSSAANAILIGDNMIKNGEADIAICGGTDALTRFTINGFNALKNVDKNRSIPFDENRNGLNLGEAAAYLILEPETNALPRGITPYARLKGYGNTNEAHHPTAPAPDGSGAYRTMKEALDHAGLTEDAVDYINAHGTATLGNDLSEGMAISRLFKQKVPPFSSTKSFTGHTLAASGAVEAIFSCMALHNDFIPGNLRFTTPMKETGLIPQKNIKKQASVKHVLSNSFGFGGNNVSLIFQKIITH